MSQQKEVTGRTRIRTDGQADRVILIYPPELRSHGYDKPCIFRKDTDHVPIVHTSINWCIIKDLELRFAVARGKCNVPRESDLMI